MVMGYGKSITSRSVYRSNRGEVVDVEALMLKHANEIASGSGPLMNARGDILGRGGRSVSQTYEDRVKAYNKNNPKAVKNISIKEEIISNKNSARIAPNTYPAPQSAAIDDNRVDNSNMPNVEFKTLEQVYEEANEKKQQRLEVKARSRGKIKRKIVEKD